MRRVPFAPVGTKNFAQWVVARIAPGRALLFGAWAPADGSSCLLVAAPTAGSGTASSTDQRCLSLPMPPCCDERERKMRSGGREDRRFGVLVHR